MNEDRIAREDRTAALAAFWNARYAGDDYAYGTEPNDFLVAQAALLPAGLPVLCLADGEGRNGVWLAGRGFDVTSIDIAQQGLDKAQALAKRAGVRLRTLRADLTRHEPLPQRARAALLARCVRALAPGGVLVFEAYGKRQPEFGTGGPPEPELLARLDDVIDELAGCEIVHRFDGVRAVHEGAHHSGNAHVVQIVARKPSG
mgnify:CR=1 FL=1